MESASFELCVVIVSAFVDANTTTSCSSIVECSKCSVPHVRAGELVLYTQLQQCCRELFIVIQQRYCQRHVQTVSDILNSSLVDKPVSQKRFAQTVAPLS